jgi:RNA polymerase sigma-70 factor (ECF subfamily)
MTSVPQAVDCGSARNAPNGWRTDEELIRCVKSRDEVALGILMKKHTPRVLSVALGVLRQRPEAEEVTQDVFWALWRSPERFDAARGPLLTWLMILARSRALDRLRQIQANARREKELRVEVSSTAPDAGFFGLDRDLAIRELLHRLPPEQGWVVQKAYFEGYALGEIAGLHGAPLGTIKGRARFALKRLRSELGPRPQA